MSTRGHAVIGAAAGVGRGRALVAQFGGLPRVQPLVGLIVILAIAYVLLDQPPRHRRRTVAWGLALQIVFALIVLKTAIGQRVFETLGAAITQLLDSPTSARRSSSGRSATRPVWAADHEARCSAPEGARYGVIFAFQVLPTIIFIAALFAILYYFGVMQVVVRVFAVVMHRVMRASGAESLNVAASIFMGQTEAPLTIRPFLPRMTAVRADDGDDLRHGAHLGRHHGGLHPVRHRGASTC